MPLQFNGKGGGGQKKFMKIFEIGFMISCNASSTPILPPRYYLDKVILMCLSSDGDTEIGCVVHEPLKCVTACLGTCTD